MWPVSTPAATASAVSWSSEGLGTQNRSGPQRSTTPRSRAAAGWLLGLDVPPRAGRPAHRRAGTARASGRARQHHGREGARGATVGGRAGLSHSSDPCARCGCLRPGVGADGLHRRQPASRRARWSRCDTTSTEAPGVVAHRHGHRVGAPAPARPRPDNRRRSRRRAVSGVGRGRSAGSLRRRRARRRPRRPGVRGRSARRPSTAGTNGGGVPRRLPPVQPAHHSRRIDHGDRLDRSTVRRIRLRPGLHHAAAVEPAAGRSGDGRDGRQRCGSGDGAAVPGAVPTGQPRRRSVEPRLVSGTARRTDPRGRRADRCQGRSRIRPPPRDHGRPRDFCPRIGDRRAPEP